MKYIINGKEVSKEEFAKVAIGKDAFVDINADLLQGVVGITNGRIIHGGTEDDEETCMVKCTQDMLDCKEAIGMYNWEFADNVDIIRKFIYFDDKEAEHPGCVIAIADDWKEL